MSARRALVHRPRRRAGRPGRIQRALALALLLGAPWLTAELAADLLLRPALARASPRPAVPYRWQLPLGFPEPPVPADNPMSQAKIALGRYLFYDVRLSGPGTYACASCHQQARAFSDGRPRAIGATGESHAHGAPSLANAAYAVRLGWADPTLVSLEQQARVPLLNEHPVEMGVAGRVAEIEQRLAAIELYPPLFAAAFPGDASPLRMANVERALAAFERTLISGRSPYDRLLFGDERGALSASARRGLALYFSERLACGRCHGGILLAGPSARAGTPPPEPRFHDTGLGPGVGDGVEAVTGRPEDRGRFRAPTLRNIAVTAPYMHDGRFATLDAVLDHYAAAGERGDARRDPLLRGFALSPQERADLLAFLEALTDRQFLSDPQLASPFEPAQPAEAAGMSRGPSPTTGPR